MSLPFWIYWQGIPTPDHVADPADPGDGRLRHGVRVRLAGASLERCARAPSRSAGFRISVLAVVATGWLLHSMHAQPMAQPGLTKTLFALVFGVAVWGWVLGLTGAALRFLSDYSATRRYHRRRLVLDLPRAPAGGRRVADVGRPLAAALEREVPVHPRRELRGAVR